MDANNQKDSPQIEKITLGGGCFWCLEAVYDNLVGVTDVVSGYAGGKLPNPSYMLVCTGLTGHAEVVQVSFDASRITTKEILEVFFSIHDPTTLNRQGADVGSQYRSAIFYHSLAQKEAAEELMGELSAEKVWNSPLVTELVPLKTFYRAEDYHQEYFAHHPEQGYCQAVIAPKMAKFRKKFAARIKV
jgi:peptide-methionine (S)-S-oxide reductase